jgi:hypothetical protein
MLVTNSTSFDVLLAACLFADRMLGSMPMTNSTLFDMLLTAFFFADSTLGSVPIANSMTFVDVLLTAFFFADLAPTLILFSWPFLPFSSIECVKRSLKVFSQ